MTVPRNYAPTNGSGPSRLQSARLVAGDGEFVR
jgi:hypothetical protein